jgi:hypothetical protein
MKSFIFLSSFNDLDDYRDFSIVHPVENQLAALKNQAWYNKWCNTSDNISASNSVNKKLYNPLSEMVYGDCDIDTISANISSNKVINKKVEDILKSNNFYDIIPLTPLNCSNILFSNAYNRITIDHYWNIMRKKIIYRLDVRAGLRENIDYMLLRRGIFMLIILLKAPAKMIIKSMLYPEGIESFREAVFNMYNDGDGSLKLFPINVAASERPNEVVKRASEYTTIIIKPVMIDIAYLYGDFVMKSLSVEDRREFINTFIDGLFYMIAIEHRVVSFDTDTIESFMLKMIHNSAFNQEYSDESHLEPLYITEEDIDESDTL